jgi:hypothetical protein
MVRVAWLLSALLAAATCAASPETTRGEVALTDSPFCEFFVVRAGTSFSLLDWRGGLYVISEGDLVDGPLTTVGLHVFVFNSSDEMKARVEDVDINLATAQRVYFSRCHHKTPDLAPGSGVAALK